MYYMTEIFVYIKNKNINTVLYFYNLKII